MAIDKIHEFVNKRADLIDEVLSGRKPKLDSASISLLEFYKQDIQETIDKLKRLSQ